MQVGSDTHAQVTPAGQALAQGRQRRFRAGTDTWTAGQRFVGSNKGNMGEYHEGWCRIILKYPGDGVHIFFLEGESEALRPGQNVVQIMAGVTFGWPQVDVVVGRDELQGAGKLPDLLRCGKHIPVPIGVEKVPHKHT